MGAQRDYPAHFFDINSPAELFRSLSRTLERLKHEKVKETDRLLYLIMGLTHLREWIAPGYDYKKEPQNDAQRFYRAIFELESFKTLQALCNHSKHMSNLDGSVLRSIATEYDSTIDDWPDVDAVSSFDLGPPTGYFVNGRNLLSLIDEVIAFYDVQWFKGRGLQQC